MIRSSNNSRQGRRFSRTSGRGSLQGQSLSPSTQSESYMRIKKRIALTWSTRFVILRGSELYCFHSKQDASLARNLIEVIQIQSGQISTRNEMSVDLVAKDGKEYFTRLFSRGDFAMWVTAFYRLALKREGQTCKRHFSDDDATSEETTAATPVEPIIITEDQAAQDGTRRRVSFHDSVLVRMIPTVPQDQVPDLFYSKEDVDKFTADSMSLLCRTEGVVNSAYRVFRRPALLWRRQAV